MRCIYDADIERSPAAPLDRDLCADVVVVGAGFAGIQTARALAASGRSVVILEARHVGAGASGRNGGILFPAPGLIWCIDGALPRDEARWAVEEIEARMAALIADLVASDGGPEPVTMYLAAPTRLAAQAIRWLTPHLGGSWCAGVDLEAYTGQRALAALALDAHTVQPMRLTLSLLRSAIDAGVQIFEGTSATHVGGDGVVTSTGYRVRAQQVITAIGAWGGRRPSQTWMLASPPLPAATLEALGGSSTVVGTIERSFTHRRIHGQRLLFGGIDEVVHAPGELVPPDVGPRLQDLLQCSIPRLPPFEPEAVWGGAIHARAHELPLIQRRDDGVVEIGAICSVYWAFIAAQLARGLAFPSLDTPADARLRACIAATRVPVLSTLSLGVRLLYRALCQGTR